MIAITHGRIQPGEHFMVLPDLLNGALEHAANLRISDSHIIK
jgi:hypothetical protein